MSLIANSQIKGVSKVLKRAKRKDNNIEKNIALKGDLFECRNKAEESRLIELGVAREPKDDSDIEEPKKAKKSPATKQTSAKAEDGSDTDLGLDQ